MAVLPGPAGFLAKSHLPRVSRQSRLIIDHLISFVVSAFDCKDDMGSIPSSSNLNMFLRVLDLEWDPFNLVKKYQI